MENLTPKKIVEELDKYIVGQHSAKKSVAIALRNRYRRSLLPKDIRDEITPKNIIMIGPTGVGKTEIARRLAKLVKAPFIKVEATKFTEVGYVGRDVESMVRDLVEASIRMVKSEKIEQVKDKAKVMAENRIVDELMPYRKRSTAARNPLEMFFGSTVDDQAKEDKDEEMEKRQKRAEILAKLRQGLLEDTYIEIEVEDTSTPTIEMFTGMGTEEMNINIQDIFGGLFPKRKKKRKLTIREARKIIEQEEAQKLIDMDEVISQAITRAEQDGIIFLDEIDKIAGKEMGAGPDVSREGVQRDILPIVEGSTVMTKYGPVNTDYILFIAAGAFHISKVSDLIPELQGRFPIRVELDSLSKEDFKNILTQPQNAIIKQYTALLQTEGINITFTEDAIDEIAEIAYLINSTRENIGARRLHTVMEKLIEDISFNAPDIEQKDIKIDRDFVKTHLRESIKENDLSRFIL